VTVVQNRFVDPAGLPYVGAEITVRLNVLGDMGLAAASLTLAGETSTTTDANGDWTLELRPNAEIEPGDSYYEVEQMPRFGQATLARFVVPDSNVAMWLGDLLVYPDPDELRLVPILSAEMIEASVGIERTARQNADTALSDRLVVADEALNARLGTTLGQSSLDVDGSVRVAYGTQYGIDADGPYFMADPADVPADEARILDPLTFDLVVPGEGGTAAVVQSVNGKSGDVTLLASDVGAAGTADLTAETTARTAAVATEAAARAAGDTIEAAARANGDAVEAAARVDAVGTEAAARAAGDTTEAAARTAADTAESTARIVGDTNEAASRVAADNAETTARIAGDAAEATARSDADTAEAATRAAADTARVLATRLISTGSGLTGGGDLTANRTLAVDFAAVQAKDDDLDWLSANLSAFARTFLDDASLVALRTTLGLVEGMAAVPVNNRYIGPTGARTTLAMALNRLYSMPIWIANRVHVSGLAVEVTTAVATSIIRPGVYGRGASNLPGAKLVEGPTIDASVIGRRDVAVDLTLERGLYFVGCAAQVAAPTVRSLSSPVYSLASLSPEGTAPILAYTNNAVSGALPDPAAATASSSGAPLVWMLVDSVLD
jgi:hypothetical protein